MSLDKELYQQAYQQYREWNEAELRERYRNAGQLPPEETRRRYIELVEFCWKLCPERSERQWKQKWTDWDRYYERVKRLEAWRQSYGKTS